jgi:hypothetical protein
VQKGHLTERFSYPSYSDNHVRYQASVSCSQKLTCRRSIAAARMYRSLLQHVFSTEYVYVHDVLHCSLRAARQLASPLFRSSKLPQVSQRNPQYKAANIRTHIRFASGAQSNETAAMSARASVFMPTNHVELEFPPDISIPKDLDVDLLSPSEGDHSPVGVDTPIASELGKVESCESC